MPDDERQLVQRAKRGEQAAFAEIYEQHYDAIYAYLFYRCGNATLSEDLASEVFLRLVTGISRYTYRGRPMLAWLYTVARNLLADHYRRETRIEPSSLDENLVDAGPGPAASAERRLAQECLGRALRHLSESHQQVVLLRFSQGLSHADTAAILGRTLNATKVMQHRALKALKKAIKTEGCYEA